MSLRLALFFVCLLFACLAAVVSGSIVLPPWFMRGTATPIPANAALITTALLGGLAGLALGAERSRDASQPVEPGRVPLPQRLERHGVLLFAAVWLLVVLPLALLENRLALLPMTLGLGAAAAAIVAAQRAGRLLDGGDRIELQHDILGIGGGLGGWRLSQAAATGLLSLLLLAAAVALSVAGLPGLPKEAPACEPAAHAPASAGCPAAAPGPAAEKPAADKKP